MVVYCRLLFPKERVPASPPLLHQRAAFARHQHAPLQVIDLGCRMGIGVDAEDAPELLDRDAVLGAGA
jgi:hypothetical protein